MSSCSNHKGMSGEICARLPSRNFPGRLWIDIVEIFYANQNDSVWKDTNTVRKYNTHVKNSLSWTKMLKVLLGTILKKHAKPSKRIVCKVMLQKKWRIDFGMGEISEANRRLHCMERAAWNSTINMAWHWLRLPQCLRNIYEIQRCGDCRL